MSCQALSGLRVADFSRVLAGPLATMTLGDLGAEVVKVEAPNGDDTRHWGPPFSPDGQATYFLAANRNKKSIVLDLRQDDDRALAQRLVERSDVLVENFRPGVMERLGLGWDEAHRLNPGLVYCSITGFGRAQGASLSGYDALVQAVGGLMSVTGAPDGDATKTGAAVIDVVAGLNAVAGILAALIVRQGGGQGQRVEVSLMASSLASLVNHASAFLGAGITPRRVANGHPSIEPYSTYDAADGPIMLCVGNDGQFAALCMALGLPEMSSDERFVTNAARVVNRDPLRSILAARLADGTREHWARALPAVGVPCGPVNDLAQAFALAAELGLQPISEVDGFLSVRSPIELSESPVTTRSPPPGLDEHGEELRRWLSVEKGSCGLGRASG